MNFFDSLSRYLGRLDPLIPNEILILLLLLGVLIFVWDMFDRQSTKIRKSGGLNEKSEVVAMRGSAYLPSRDFTSERLGLSSRPHGLIREEGFLIPVDVNPLSKKIKDRHIVQMLVHLRLIEESEGKRPPYGVLVMGPEARSVRVRNTEEKQRWLSTMLDEMRSIMDGVPAVPAPAFYKCKSCDVRAVCNFSAYKTDETRSGATPQEEAQEEVSQEEKDEPEPV